MSPRHHSQLYRQLRDVDPNDAQRIIRMYEEKEQEIGRLDVEEHFDLTVYYADALFSTGAYRQHLMMVDLVIQACIVDNLTEVPGVEGDVFEHLLFRKSVSAYRLRDYAVAAHVARELIRINPGREMYVRFLRLVLFRSQRKLLQFGRGGFIFCLLVTAAVIVVQLLVLQPLFPSRVEEAQGLILALFLCGITIILGANLGAHLRAHIQAYGFRRQKQNK